MPDLGAVVAVRPLEAADVGPAWASSWESLREAGTRYGWEMPELDDRRRARGEKRLLHLLHTDPDGCWVADRDGKVVGVAFALCRGPLWFLSLLTVAPGAQAQGVGGRLLEAALRTSRGLPAGMIISSGDPKALRRYAQAGFTLQPGYDAAGTVDRSLLPAVGGVREGDWDADRERVDDLGRRLRGAAYGPDLDAYRSAGARLLVADDGFAVARPEGPAVVGATEPATAQALLWTALAEATGRLEIGPFTAAQQWALEVALSARLALRPGESVCTRGAVGPLTPYLPGGAYG